MGSSGGFFLVLQPQGSECLNQESKIESRKLGYPGQVLGLFIFLAAKALFTAGIYVSDQ